MNRIREDDERLAKTYEICMAPMQEWLLTHTCVNIDNILSLLGCPKPSAPNTCQLEVEE